MATGVERYDRTVAILLALTMVLSVGATPVAASVGGGSQPNSMTLTTSVSSCTTITSPGRYELTGDITNSGATTCIRIAADDVTLDGNGYTIEGVDDPDTRGVYVYEEATEEEPNVTLDNVTVTNLGVTDWERGIEFARVSNGTVDGVDAWSNVDGVRFDVLSRDHEVYGSGFADNEVGLLLDGGGGAVVQENYFETNDRGIEVSSDDNDVVYNELIANYDGVRVSYADGTDILGNYFEDQQSISVLLDSSATQSLVRENEIYGSAGALAGIWVDNGDNEVIGNVLSGTGENGIAVASDRNFVASNRVESVEDGLAVYSAAENEFEENTVRDTQYAIRLEDGARDNVFRGDDVANNDWAFYATWDASSRAENLFIGNSTTPTTLSFWAHDVALQSVSSPPSVPPSMGSLDKFVYTENTSSSGDLDLSVHYTDDEANDAGINESRLRLWRHDGSWNQVSPTNQVDTSANTVSADVTNFGVISPLATANGTVSRVAFKYGEYGGNLNIEINGEFVNFEQFWELDGATVGGTILNVTNTSVSGGEQGTVEIVGSVDSFAVGGQEMFMDSVTFGPDWGPRATVDFETLSPSQSEYVVGETFRSSPDNVQIAVEEFVWSDGTVYYDGEAKPVTNSPSYSGGSGQELYPDNVNVRFNVEEIVNSTSQP